MQPTEVDLLRIYLDRMEAEGKTRKLVRISIDEVLVQECSSLGFVVDLDQLLALADRCLARDWLEPTELGGKYTSLALTSTGVGVVRSRQASAEKLAQRSWPKRASDFIEDHKGLFIVLGAAIALAGLMIKVLGD